MVIIEIRKVAVSTGSSHALEARKKESGSTFDIHGFKARRKIKSQRRIRFVGSQTGEGTV